MGWLLYDTVGTNYYPITNEKLVRQISGLNYVTCKLEDVVLASNTLVNVLDESGTIVFTGFIKKTADPTDDINRYEITERARELQDELCETSVGSNVYNFTVASATVDTLLLFDILAGTGWTSGSSDTTSMDEVAFYYETKFDALFRLLVDYRDHFVWFNNTTKYVYFGSSRTDRTASDVGYISKNAEVDSNNRVYDKIIVIGANDSITAWTGAHGGTVKCYQMPEIKSSYEASKMVGTLWSIMGTSNKGRVTVILEPTSLYDEGDLVSIDGSNYIVYNVEMSSVGTKLVCDSRTTNINDVFVEEKYKPTYDSATSGGAGVTNHSLLSNLNWSVAGHIINTDVDMDANSLDDIWNADFYAISGTHGRLKWIYNSESGNYFEVREITGNALATFVTGQGYATSFRTIDSSLNLYNLRMIANTIIGAAEIRSHYTGTMKIISDHLMDPDVVEFEFANGVNMKVGNDMSFQDLYYIKNLKDPVANQDGATKKYVDDNAGDFFADGSVPMTGNLTTSGHLIMSTYVAGEQLDTSDSVDQVWLLCANTGGNNECIGNFMCQRSSGHWDAINLDVVISTGSTAEVYGFIGCNQQLGTDASNSFSLITCTYNSISYVALRYVGDQYSFTSPMIFTGITRCSVADKFKNLSTSSVTDVTDLPKTSSKVTFMPALFGIGTTTPTEMLEVAGKIKALNGIGINEFSVDGTLAGNSDDVVPTEQAVKTYVDDNAGGDFLADGSVPMTGDIDIGNQEIDNCNKINMDAGFHPAAYINPVFTDPTYDLKIWGESEIMFFNGSLGSESESVSITTEHLDLHSNKIVSVGTPTADTDAATKGYVDALPGVDGVSFILDQDNAGAGVSSSLRFNRGSTDGDAAIWWDEGDDEFQFESDVGVTVGSILIDECRHGGSVKTSRNPSTGDYEIEVASGDSIVFKAV